MVCQAGFSCPDGGHPGPENLVVDLLAQAADGGPRGLQGRPQWFELARPLAYCLDHSLLAEQLVRHEDQGQRRRFESLQASLQASLLRGDVGDGPPVAQARRAHDFRRDLRCRERAQQLRPIENLVCQPGGV